MKLKITVDGKLYEVDVEVFEPESAHPGYFLGPGHARVPAGSPVIPTLPPSPVTAGPSPVANESKVCRSPFAGAVTKVSVQAGQTIQVNDVLLILEAMKMETVITAPIAGKASRVNVNEGDAVQQGQVLVEFE